MKNKQIFKMVLSGCLIAIGWTLPLVTGQIREIGNMLCPMHLPVFFGALLLGPWYGLIIGLIIPTSRSLIFGMPVIFPNAVCMSIELGTYGFVCGFLFNYIFRKYRKNSKELIISTIISLLVAMIIGRVIWGLSRIVCLLIPGNDFTMKIFISGAILTAWPGIIIQLIVIPLTVIAMKNKFIINENEIEKLNGEEI